MVFCFHFNKIYINLLSLIISIIIINSIFVIPKSIKRYIFSKSSKGSTIQIDSSKHEEKVDIDENTTKEEFDWALKIPKIDLYAQIEEGTDDTILNRSIGHFEDTQRRNRKCVFSST